MFINMAIKEIDDQKIINFNPTFLYYELVDIFKTSSALPIVLSIILLGFIILMLYYFFEFEFIFLYKLWFNKIEKTKEEQTYQMEKIQKIRNILESRIECIEGKSIIVKRDGTQLRAKNLDGEDLGKIPFCQNIS